MSFSFFADEAALTLAQHCKVVFTSVLEGAGEGGGGTAVEWAGCQLALRLPTRN